MTIQVGHCYWVDIDGHRFRMKAMEPVDTARGWWRWQSPDGGESIMHESRAVEECHDDPTALNWSDA